MSNELAKELRKVLTAWTGPQIRTAGGHLITPVGRCTGRVTIDGFIYVCDFVVLPHCSRDVILGLDFLQANGAVINLQEPRVTFSPTQAIEIADPDDSRIPALRIAADDVTVPPRCSMMVPVQSDSPGDRDVMAERNVSLLLEKGICAARGLVRLRDRSATLLITNFGTEFQPIAKGTAVAYVTDFVEPAEICALELPSPDGRDAATVLSTVDINPACRWVRSSAC